MVGSARAELRYAGRPPTPETFEQSVAYRLPFDGWWRVGNGGVSEPTSHSWDVVNQRYAYDFVVEDETGSTFSGDGTRLADYYAYGAPLRAPADGTVVELRDGVRDAAAPGTGAIDWRTRDFRGNYVVLRHADGEYSFTAHLIPGSIEVRIGMDVSRGELLGRCGNSGHSTEPHLHFHLQDRADFYTAAGLPVRFSDYLVRAGEHAEPRVSGWLTAGELVAPALPG